jgi:microtubule-associated protein-like 6
MMHFAELDTPARALCFSPDGQSIAVGVGDGSRARKKGFKKDGTILILSSSDFKVLFETKDNTEWIRVVKYSPNGKILIVGGNDAKVVLYNVEDGYSRRALFTACASPITSIDFTVDSMYFQVSDASQNIVYGEVNGGVQIPNAATLKDAKWATWTSEVGWHVQGAWFNQPDRSRITKLNRNHTGNYFLSGDQCGRLNLFRFPSPQPCPYQTYFGHGSFITSIAWSSEDDRVISISAEDYTIYQWRVVPTLSAHGEERGDMGGDSGEDSELEVDGGFGFFDPSLDTEPQDEWKEGDVRPWTQAIVPPSEFNDEDTGKPKLSVELEYIYGLRSDDVRQAIRYNANGDVVFFTSSLGVIFSKLEHQQAFYEGHESSITSLALSHDGLVCATGEVGKNPRIHLWDATTTLPLSTLGNCHQKGISHLAFSPSKHYLVSVGRDRTNAIAVHFSPSSLWTDAFTVSSMSSGPGPILSILFSGNSDFPLFVSKKRSSCFIDQEGRSLNVEDSFYGKNRKIQPLICSCTVRSGSSEGPSILTGTSSGHIYVWDSSMKKIENVVSAHLGPCYTIIAMQPQNSSLLFASGGKDGFVRIFDTSFQVAFEFNLLDFVPEPYFPIPHSLSCSKTGRKLLVGCKGSEVYEISLDSSRAICLLEGHSKSELWGLCPCPTNRDLIASSGDDCIVRVWSLRQRKCLSKTNLGSASRCIDWSSNGHLIAVGIGGESSSRMKDGAFMVLHSGSLEVIHEDRKSKRWIRDVRFSPNSQLLAIASDDGRIFIHETSKFELAATCVSSGSGSSITHIDFSDDGLIL